jgi:hypothetical protein
MGSGFRAVSCTSGSACTAVGGASSNSIVTVSVPLAERWNGVSWSIEQSPAVHDGLLIGVSCASPRFCAAVGSRPSRTDPILVERWNGTGWSVQRTPRNRDALDLEGVSCSSRTACVAVGEYAAGGPNPGPLVERWNGGRWAIEPTATPRGARGAWLDAVSCASSSACTAVGGYNTPARSGLVLIERWNGTRWSIQRPARPARAAIPFPGGILSAVSCPSLSACTAVGGYFPVAGDGQAGGELSLAERWNARRWSVQPTPNPANSASGVSGSSFSSLSCPTVNVCTAVGSLNGVLPLAERWTGGR